MIALLFAIVFSSPAIHDRCDLIELNHMHDRECKPTFSQVIFWHWDAETNRYDVRAWRIADVECELPRVSYTSKSVSVSWFDREFSMRRIIVANHYRESWSQIDPERDNLQLIPERERMSLVRRIIRPVPDDAPMETQ